MNDKDDKESIDENGESCSQCGFYLENCECFGHGGSVGDNTLMSMGVQNL